MYTDFLNQVCGGNEIMQNKPRMPQDKGRIYSRLVRNNFTQPFPDFRTRNASMWIGKWMVRKKSPLSSQISFNLTREESGSIKLANKTALLRLRIPCGQTSTHYSPITGYPGVRNRILHDIYKQLHVFIIYLRSLWYRCQEMKNYALEHVLTSLLELWSTGFLIIWAVGPVITLLLLGLLGTQLLYWRALKHLITSLLGLWNDVGSLLLGLWSTWFRHCRGSEARSYVVRTLEHMVTGLCAP